MMHGVTYPSAPGKQEKIPLSGVSKLPPINTSLGSLTPTHRGQRASRSVTTYSKGRGSQGSSLSSTKLKHKRSMGSLIPIENVMEMNKNAMSFIKDGKLKRGSETLRTAMTAAEEGVRYFENAANMSGARNPEQREAWLLALAATLSNFGCLRRRENNLQDALRLLKHARDVEMKVFGRPSCSTMVNLSAVLLGLGSTEEALVIARDCAFTSEQSDPMLHIIALHNYGVTLSHHATEEMRQSAAPVLMKALRQAESQLGENHSTTVMIREHCGMAVKKTRATDTAGIHNNEMIAPVARSLENKRSLSTSQRGTVSHKLSSAVLPPVYSQRVREALQTLDYGKMPLTAGSFSPSEAQASSLPHNESSTKHLVCSSGPGSSLALPPITPTGTPMGDAISPFLPCNLSFNEAHSVYCEEAIERTLYTDYTRKTASTISQNLNEDSEVSEKMSEDAEQGDICLDFTARPTKDKSEKFGVSLYMDGADSGKEWYNTGDSEENDTLDEDIESPQREETKIETDNIRLDTLAMTQRPKSDKVRGEYVTISLQRREMVPSFYRFAPAEILLEPPVPVGDSNVAAIESPGTTSDKLFMDLDEEETEMSNGFDTRNMRNDGNMPLGDTIIKSVVKKRETFFNIIGSSPSRRRRERMKQEREEEEALRDRLHKEALEAEKKEYFERTLEAIITRTRNRAAIKIQYTWVNWWNSVGRRRRELLAKRAEEKARRERSRQALLEHERRVGELRIAKKTPKKASVVELVPSVLRCGRKWLEKTTCVRYLARRKISCKDENNTFFALKTAKIQAAWRGYRTRQKVREMILDQAQLWTLRRKVEIREHAAMVIQMFFRRYTARRIRKMNFAERYGPPAIRIQRWARWFMPRRRALGLDKISKWRREYSARMIQRAWRSYCHRLAYFMARLRYRLDEDRRRERAAAHMLKRIGRGYICRCKLEKRRLQDLNLRSVMYAIEYGNNKAEKDVTAATAVSSVSKACTYVPTSVQEVDAVAKLEREKYHIGIFLDTVAARERAEWAEALRLRPFEVHRRRAHEDHLCQLELNASRRERAARKIQREFRRWLRIRDEPFRDNTLLIISRGFYQVSEYDKKISRIRHERELNQGQIIFGDQTAPMREARAKVQTELEEVRPLVRTHILLDEVRSSAERYKVEKELQEDEKLVEGQMRSEALSKKRELRLRQAIKAQSAYQAIS